MQRLELFVIFMYSILALQTVLFKIVPEYILLILTDIEDRFTQTYIYHVNEGLP